MDTRKFLVVFVILFMIVLVPQIEKSYAQAYGAPEGKDSLSPYDVFDFGILMQKGDAFEYKVTSDETLDFSLHNHDRNNLSADFCFSCPQPTQTYKSEESTLFEGRFIADKDTSFYISAENTNPTSTTLQYSITMYPKTHNVEYDSTPYDISILTNSQLSITDFNPLEKTLTLHIETPKLTEAYVKVIIPKFLLGGPFELQIIPADHIKSKNISETDSDSIIEFTTYHGTYDVTIVGTTAIPEIPFPLLILVLAIIPLLVIPRLKNII